MREGRRLRFLKDFDYKPKPQVTISYKAGDIKFVRLECSQQALAKGVAEPYEFQVPSAGIAAQISRKVNNGR